MKPAPTAITLDLNRIDELFQAPDADPFSSHEVAILGQCGMELLRKLFVRNWPRRRAASQLQIRLLAESQPAEPAADQPTGQEPTTSLAQTTRAAIRRYCDLRQQANRAAQRLEMAEARRQLLIALVVTIIALALLALCMAIDLSELRGNVLALVTLLAVYAASLSIWDALESLFFDWTPFMVDNLAWQWISSLEVQIVAGAGQPSS